MKNPEILQIVGFSGSGKTTFISSLIKVLKEKKTKILTIKSARNHKYKLSKKDTDVFLESGTDLSVAIFENATQMTSNSQIDLNEIVEYSTNFVKPDIIILEGFKEKGYPKVVFWTKEFTDSFKDINAKEILYVYCSERNYREFEGKINEFVEKTNAFLENDINKLVERIVEDFKL